MFDNYVNSLFFHNDKFSKENLHNRPWQPISQFELIEEEKSNDVLSEVGRAINRKPNCSSIYDGKLLTKYRQPNEYWYREWNSHEPLPEYAYDHIKQLEMPFNYFSTEILRLSDNKLRLYGSQAYLKDYISLLNSVNSLSNKISISFQNDGNQVPPSLLRMLVMGMIEYISLKKEMPLKLNSIKIVFDTKNDLKINWYKSSQFQSLNEPFGLLINETDGKSDEINISDFTLLNDMYDYSGKNNYFYYRDTRAWWKNGTNENVKDNQEEIFVKIDTEKYKNKYRFVVPLKSYEGMKWTRPYWWCYLNSEWIVSIYSPFWLNDGRYGGLSEIDLVYNQMPIDQCNGDNTINIFAGLHQCPKNSYCRYVNGNGLLDRNYQCVCQTGHVQLMKNNQIVCEKIENQQDFPLVHYHRVRRHHKESRMKREIINYRKEKSNNWEMLYDLLDRNYENEFCYGELIHEREKNLEMFIDHSWKRQFDYHLRVVMKDEMNLIIKIAQLFSAYYQLTDEEIGSDYSPTPPIKREDVAAELLSGLEVMNTLFGLSLYWNETFYSNKKELLDWSISMWRDGMRTDNNYRRNDTIHYDHWNYVNYLSSKMFDENEDGKNKDNFYGPSDKWRWNEKDRNQMDVEMNRVEENKILRQTHFKRYSTNVKLRKAFGKSDYLEKIFPNLLLYSDGKWIGPYHLCSSVYERKNNELYNNVHYRFVSPITNKERIVIGYVVGLLPLNILKLKINPCSRKSYGSPMFFNLHHCPSTTTCVFNEINWQYGRNKRFLSGYRCVCRKGYVFPYRSIPGQNQKDVDSFPGHLIEESYYSSEKYLYSRLRCRKFTKRFTQHYSYDNFHHYSNNEKKSIDGGRVILNLLFSFIIIIDYIWK
ncbi:hypothetical protein SNEBB_010748 [Seison nebaliae]|nr:hypothetical protein SNEBB_010748 [Seison nebaliae]